MSRGSENEKDLAQAKLEANLASANAEAKKAGNDIGIDTSIITNSYKVPPMDVRNAYRGARVAWFCYHPALHGNDEYAFDRAIPVFMRQWTDWWKIAELYQGEMVLSEKVTVPQLKREMQKLVNEICKSRKVYVLEALAEALWDKDGATPDMHGGYHGKSEKTSRHELPYMYELEQRAKEIQALDCGIQLATPMGRHSLIRHTWAG